MAAEPSPDTEAVLEAARSAINSALLKGDFETAGVVIAKHVPLLLQWGEDTWVEDPEPPPGPQEDGASAANEETESGESLSNSSDDSDGDSSSDSNDEEASSAPQITSYRYRSVMHNPRNPRLEHLCTWLYDTVVHPESGEEPEETSCQKLPAAILAAWKRLAASSPSPSQQQQPQPQQQQQQEQQEQQQPQPEGSAACSADVAPQTPTTATEGAAGGAAADGAGGAAASAGAGAAPSEQQPQQPQQQQPQQPQQPQQAQAQEAPLPPTELLHLQHSAFSAPYCTWRPVAPDALPPLHDVLVGVLRVCWERHDDREPSRNIIWGAQSHSRRDDPVTAYLYVEYLRLLVGAIVRGRAEPLWLWHELQEIIEEYPHWRHHPHEVAVLARMMVEHGCGWRLLNSLLDHIGKGPMLMYGTWAALWDGLRRPEARACARLAGRHGRVSQEAVWTHVAELTLLQVKEHPTDAKLLDRAVAVLSRAIVLAPQPAALAALLRAERDAPGSCAGVRDVTTQLGDILNNPPPPLATPPPPKGAADAAGAGGKGKEAEKAEA
ncbi:hypothetical protein CHLRE_08g359650v5 [Chlamydomonas reinhardtii]|uniref:Uncharacterized protein n=1 Tax=Chlamydomonas reinhardtii TaxID=3055 RepID=A0A2K3DGD0_CHLRE|nr:uncharacterized protein CHLRE_08g359650v5 [Chlamydomonas reinhardtii]PNW79603.1 hypothetical protein CHLRE_08g359650v5 [Chlamydomonas reinhardtii]